MCFVGVKYKKKIVGKKGRVTFGEKILPSQLMNKIYGYAIPSFFPSDADPDQIIVFLYVDPGQL